MCRGLNQSSIKIFWGTVIIFYLFHAIAKFSYCWTDLTKAIISRQSIIFLPLIVIMAMIFLSDINKKYGLKKSYCALAMIFLLVIYWPDASKNCGVRTIELYNENKEIRKFLEANFPDKNEYIVITKITGYFVCLGYSTMSFYSDLPNERFIDEDKVKEKRKEENLQLMIDLCKRKACSHIILIQNLDKDTNDSVYTIPEIFKEEVLLEKQYYDGKILKFSKLTMI